jgi:hypothetical protein
MAMREKPWYVRVASLLAAVWAVSVVAFNVWAWTVPELASPDRDGLYEYAAFSVIGLAVAAIGLVAAISSPGWGAIGGGLWVTLYAALLSPFAVTALTHWGEIVDPDQGRTTPWVPLDSLGVAPFLVLLVAGVLLLVGGIVHVWHPAVKSWSEMRWHVRVAGLLVAVWAVWLCAFVVWGWTIDEWGSENFAFGYTVISGGISIVVAASMVAAILSPGWGAIGGGLVVTFLAQGSSRDAVTELGHWGEFMVPLNEPRFSGWVPLDSLDLVPYWVLLPAGVLLVVGGILHVLHPTHGTTPHAGAAT